MVSALQKLIMPNVPLSDFGLYMFYSLLSHPPFGGSYLFSYSGRVPSTFPTYHVSQKVKSRTFPPIIIYLSRDDLLLLEREAFFSFPSYVCLVLYDIEDDAEQKQT